MKQPLDYGQSPKRRKWPGIVLNAFLAGLILLWLILFWYGRKNWP